MNAQAFELRVFGRDFRTKLAPPAEQMTLAELSPMAGHLCDQVAAVAAGQLAQRGSCVACRKGCSRCCNYMVSVSAPEAMALWGHLAALPAARRQAIVSRYLEASRTLLARRPPQDFAVGGQGAGAEEISQWYSQLNLSCPFIDGGACSIYAVRPLVCREHVSSSSASCDSGSGNGGLKLPLSVAEAMSQLSVELEPSWPAAIALPVALVWASGPDVHPRRHPSGMVLSRLASLLQQQQAALAA